MWNVAFGRWIFKPSPWGTSLAVAFVVLTLSLGEWQAGRAIQKQEMQEQLDTRSQEPAVRLSTYPQWEQNMAYRRVEGNGEFVQGFALLIDNRVYKKQAGFHVISLFKLDGVKAHILVNRGWVAARTSRERTPEIPKASGMQGLRGHISIPPSGIYELGAESVSGPIRQHLVVDRIAAEFGVKLPPFVILEEGESKDGLVRDWPRPDAGVNTHLAYALQWRALAVAAFLAWLYFSIGRSSRHG